MKILNTGLMDSLAEFLKKQKESGKSIVENGTAGRLLISDMKPIEIALLELQHPEFSENLGYLVASTSEHLMFESCYLTSVLGNPPYTAAIEFGLDEKDIAVYQSEWESIGINPREVSV